MTPTCCVMVVALQDRQLQQQWSGQELTPHAPLLVPATPPPPLPNAYASLPTPSSHCGHHTHTGKQGLINTKPNSHSQEPIRLPENLLALQLAQLAVNVRNSSSNTRQHHVIQRVHTTVRQPNGFIQCRERRLTRHTLPDITLCDTTPLIAHVETCKEARRTRSSTIAANFCLDLVIALPPPDNPKLSKDSCGVFVWWTRLSQIHMRVVKYSRKLSRNCAHTTVKTGKRTPATLSYLMFTRIPAVILGASVTFFL